MQLPLLIAGAAFCTAAVAGLYMEHRSDQHAQLAHLRADADLAEGLILPRSPSETLRSLHTLIGSADHGGPEPACSLMTSQARQAFAAVHGQPDCAAAVRMLGARVTNRNRYPMFKFAMRDEAIHGDQGRMDGCAITWRGDVDPADMPDPGPRLGLFVLHRVVGLGFKITGVEPCTQNAPATASSPGLAPPTAPSAVSAPTSSKQTGLLPSYAPSVPAILAGRIARNDPGACDLFTEAGRTQFTAARTAIDCPAAVASMHAQVTDPEVYRDPRGASETPGPAGRTVVDGCHLTWSSWSGQTRPGPQIGRLELERPPGQIGFLIAGYRPC